MSCGDGFWVVDVDWSWRTNHFTVGFDRDRFGSVVGHQPCQQSTGFSEVPHHAKKAGTRIVSINTVREKELEECGFHPFQNLLSLDLKLADEWVQVKIGGDLALMMAILKRLVEWDAVNHSFIEQNTKGFAELSSAVSGLSMEELSEHSGVSVSKSIGSQP